MSRVAVAHSIAGIGIAFFALAAPALAAAGDTVSGDAKAIDPDMIMVGKQRVILLGIDAPEHGQTCQDGATLWKCGDTARAVLDQIVKSGTVTCALSGRPDPFGRRGGVCTVEGKDVAEQLVGKGLALVYDKDEQSAKYEAAQVEAKAEGKGLWKKGVTFIEPWEFRRSRHPGGFK